MKIAASELFSLVVKKILVEVLTNQFLRRMTALFVAVIFSVFAARGAALSDYTKRVDEAQVLLYALYAPEEDEDETAQTPNERQNLTRVRGLLPKSETIELAGGKSFEVNNSWLYRALEQYEKSSADEPKHRRILSETAEKLGALEDRLKELETAEKTAGSKNQTKQKLDEILKRPEFLPPEKRESFIEKKSREFWDWWRNFWDWFFSNRQETPKKIDAPNTSPVFLVALFRYLFIGLAIAVMPYGG